MDDPQIRLPRAVRLASNQSVVTICTITAERHRPVRGDPPLPSRVAAAVLAGERQPARLSSVSASATDRSTGRTYSDRFGTTPWLPRTRTAHVPEAACNSPAANQEEDENG